MPRQTTWTTVGVVSALLSIAACGGSSDLDVANGDDPMRALAAAATSTRYTAGYWQTVAEQNTALWQRAVQYCDARRSAAQGAKPNCSAVASAQFEMAGRAPVQPRARRGAAAQTFTP